ncbi:MAG: 23S rRNA (uracil(1939)-C(5))-methyltransferase RlmD [Clostridiales bacterium]|nr:23S rRNA (uracil(1939)-C(5))-methyltransferase RlmD [Clostridiales bacterium]
MRKNDLLTLPITGYTHDGAGVGRTKEGYVLFVPRTAAGDLAQVRVVKVGRSFGYGRLEALIDPSPDRLPPPPDCPAFPRCGGCAYRHINYTAELAAKRRQVEAALAKALPDPPPVADVVPSPEIDRYRNKIALPVGLQGGHAVTGYYRLHSHDIVPCEDCLLQPREVSAAAQALCAHIDRHGISVYDERTHSGLVRSLFVRAGQGAGQYMAAVVVNGQTLPAAQGLTEALRAALPGLVSLQLNHHTARTNLLLGARSTLLFGQDKVEDLLLGIRHRISLHSFYQINRLQCEALYRCAIRLAGLTGAERVLDLYCGIGTIGLSMAPHCAEVLGVELLPQAVLDAAEGARQNGLHNARFLCADAAQAARQLADEGFAPDVVVLDPPRKGCDRALLQTVAGMAPGRIVYISCNPATLARDLAVLLELGYRAGEAQPFDLFPRTAHVECVTLMSRVEK